MLSAQRQIFLRVSPAPLGEIMQESPVSRPRFPKEEALSGPARLGIIQRESEARAQRLNLPRGQT